MISPIEFARKHLNPYKTSGSEVIPTYCPFCHGGDNKDKHTFGMNAETGVYNCKRGSCGVSGTFKQLLREFGEQAETDYYRRPSKQYKVPNSKPETPKQKVVAYLTQRGFTPPTWERRGVGEYKGAIAMPYCQDGKLVLMKFRLPHKPKDGEKKGWREEGGKAVFWGMDLCDHNKPLTICEGEMDALALDEAGIENVVSVPNGAQDLSCIENCWEWLDKFEQVILWVDNDEPGRKLERNLIQRLGSWRCSVIRHKRKDANEVLLLDGKQAVKDAVNGAVAVPMEGLVSLAEVPPWDYQEDVVRVRSGIRGIDQVIGGFMLGEVSVWTGINSSGKSTLLGQILIEAVDQGFAVCAYSGELAARKFRQWIDLQIAGPNNIKYRYDAVWARDVAYVPVDIATKIRTWYQDKFYFYDSFGAAKDHKIIEVFEYAARRHGCRVFLVDNIMTTVFTSTDRDFYRQQSNFVGMLKDFANRFDVHVHVVAHPRKTSGRLTKMDVSGSGDITNRTDNVFSVHRCNQQEVKDNKCNTIVDIFKNRFSGKQDVTVQLIFDGQCKRFCMAGSPADITKRYGWHNQIQGGDYPLDDL
jgi:twinkle protein